MENRNKRYQNNTFENSKYRNPIIFWEKLPPLKCSYSDEYIKDIKSTLVDDKTGLVCEFENAYKYAYDQLKDKIGNGEYVVYIGRGTFAIVSSYKRHFKIKEEFLVEFESKEERNPFRNKIKYKFSRYDELSPSPISELYTKQELDSFPKLASDLLSTLPQIVED